MEGRIDYLKFCIHEEYRKARPCYITIAVMQEEIEILRKREK